MPFPKDNPAPRPATRSIARGAKPAPRRLALILGTFLCATLFALSVSAQVPRGVFSLAAAGATARDSVLANPDLTGVVIRQDWSELEPTEGNFDWAFLDSEVARAADAGKEILLRINTQANKPDWVTTAVHDAGGTFFTLDDGVGTMIPVFWDPTYLAKKKAMIMAVGERFSNNPNLRVVGASFANATSEDWNIPNTPDDIDQWLRLGYTAEKMLDAGQQIIDTTMAAFPNQNVAMAIGGDGNLNPTPTYLAENAIANARTTWPGRFIAQINSLSTFNPVAPGPDGSVWNLLWNSRPDVAAQMLDNVYGDYTYRVNNGVPDDFGTILTASVDAGISYEVNYIEIYQTDVINLPGVITYAHDLLVSPTPSPTPVELGNLSTRLSVGTSDNVLIGGFIITGTDPKLVVVRALGPSLSVHGVTGVLANPSLELHDSTGITIATNDNWMDLSLADQMVLTDNSLAPADSAESAIVRTLNPAGYTAIVHGVNETTGVALVEVYDLDGGTIGSRFANISTRGFVQTGDNVMIGGMIVLGDSAATVIVRAIGPSLTLPGALQDPYLELHDQNGATIASNDNWRSDQEEEIIASGLAPSSDAESAIVAAIEPGPYTAIVRGVNDTTGVALVEFYQLAP